MRDSHKTELTGGGETTLHGHAGGNGGGPAEKGFIVTDSTGGAWISFTGSYATKPVVSLTPELPQSQDSVFVQIVGWIANPYTKVCIYVSDDGGKAEAGVIVHWLIWPTS